jgi:16S rRNA (cytidine1402-2'-O)-methyltransferase
LAANPATLVLFEAPHRIADLLHDLAAAVGTRRVTLCRELTKQFETVVTLPATELPAWLGADPNRGRGEFVLVLHAQAEADGGAATALHEQALATLLEVLPLKQAVALVAELSGAARKPLYQRALAMKDAKPLPPELE